MSDPHAKVHRPGGRISDLCRACKAVRAHTVMALEADGTVARVVCDFCGSEHNFRHGGDEASVPPARHPPRPSLPGAPRLAAHDAHTASAPPARRHDPDPVPSHGGGPERMGFGEMTSGNPDEIEALLRRVLREELGLTAGLPAPKWRGGQVVLKPGKPGLQERVLPIDALFHKIVMIRNRLRTLEQQVNGAEIPDDLKLRLQGYISGCYGSLTTFNVLFADEADQFKGASD